MGVLERDELCLVGVDLQTIAQEPVCDSKETICAFLSNRLMVCPSHHDGTIINIHQEGVEVPGLGNTKEREDIESR